MIDNIYGMLYRFAAASSTASVNCTDSTDPTTCNTGLPAVSATNVQVEQILQVTLGIIGAAAVLVIVLAGLRFISAQGNPQEVAKARSILLYTVVGLVVIIGAEAIVSFVLFKAG